MLQGCLEKTWIFLAEIEPRGLLMNCNEINKFSFTYLDGEFEARERGEFETHLRLCPQCRCAVQHDAMFRDVVRDHLDVPAPAGDLRNRLRERLDCSQRSQVSRHIAVPMAIAASLAVVVVVWRVVPDGDSGVSPRNSASTGRTPAPGVPPLAVANAVAAQNKFAAPKLATGKPSALAFAGAQMPMGNRAVVNNVAFNNGGASAYNNGSNGAEMTGEVLRGHLPSSALVQRSPFGAVRSEESLRAMVAVHMANLPPEVVGPAVRIQRYLATRVPRIGPLPLTEGAGIELVGARLAMIGSQPAVIYSYRAWGSALTVFSRAKASGDPDDPEVEAADPMVHGEPGMLLDRRAGLHMLHVVSRDRVLTLVSELSAQPLMQLMPSSVFL